MNVYVDIYLAKNLGDDLFLYLLANHFKDIIFTVNFYGRGYDGFLQQFSNVERPSYPLLFKVLNRLKLYNYIGDAERVSKEYDAYLLLGGSIFREESYWEAVYCERLAFAHAFKKKGKPVMVMGANFGPYQSDLFREKYRAFFSICDDVCFRDKWSYNLFGELGCVHYGSDIVFQRSESVVSVPREKVVVYSVIDPLHIPTLRNDRRHYFDWIARSMEYMIEKGYRCELLSFCESEGDLSACESILACVRERDRHHIKITNYTGNIEEIIQIISSSSAIVASRFHASILGVITGTKTLPLVYSDKTTQVLNDIRFSGEIIRIERSEQYDIDTVMSELLEKAQSFEPMNVLAQSALNHFNFLERYASGR